VTITRERHPFEGRALAVISRIRRRGVLFVLACLPDGSRALIPAQWTDWNEGDCGGVHACREANVGSRALGSLGDFASVAPSRRRSPRPIDRGRRRYRRGAVVQLNLAFFDPPDPPGGPLWENLAPSLWEQLDEPTRCAALEILARLIARMLMAAANEASYE